MRPFTLVLPYYLNAGMLAVQQLSWASLPAETRAALHVIVVDDGSPRLPATDAWRTVDGLASQRLYRTRKDVRWNWLFCRNLGVQEASTDWVLLTDIDHVVPASTWRALMTEALDASVVYRFSRVDAPDLTPYKPHPNSWCLTRAMFDKVGGYDERFSGFYGTDADFRERVQARARAVVLRPEPLIRYPREVIADASTTTYGRKEQQDRVNVQRIRDERALIPHWTPLRVTFKYDRLF